MFFHVFQHEIRSGNRTDAKFLPPFLIFFVVKRTTKI